MELKYSKAIVTVLLFAVILDLGDGIKCNNCDYDNGDCVEGKIKQKDCEQNNFVCVELKTVPSNNSTAVKYSYDCAPTGKDKILSLPGLPTLHTTHCGTDLCNKVVLQVQTIGGKNIAASSPTTKSVLDEVTIKPKVFPSNNEGKKNITPGLSGTGGNSNQNGIMSKPNITTSSVKKNSTNTTDVDNKHSKGGENNAGNVCFSIFIFLFNLLIAFII